MRVTLVLIFLTQHVLSLPSLIRIGGIFPENYRGGSTEVAFKYGVFRVNQDRRLLGNTTLVYRILYLQNFTEFTDFLQAMRTGCQLLGGGISALFLPSLGSAPLEQNFESLTASHHLSLISPSIRKHHIGPIPTEFINDVHSIHLGPTVRQLGEALKDAVVFFNWTRVAFIYEEQEDLIYMDWLIRKDRERTDSKGGLSSRRAEIFISQVNQGTYREAMTEVKSRGLFNIIVNVRFFPIFFRIMLQLQMNDARYHFHFSTLDLELYDLEDFGYNGINITAYSLLLPFPENHKLLQDLQRFNSKKTHDNRIESEAALMYDSIVAFCHGVRAYGDSSIREFTAPNISCDRDQPWSDGPLLTKHINSVSFMGLTGRITLRDGSRTDLTLSLLKLKNRSLESVGQWTETGRLKISDYKAFTGRRRRNVTLRVITVPEKPWVMMKTDGNRDFEGFCIDLLKDVAALVGFHYTIEAVQDGKYGLEDPVTKEWNGVVRDLIDGKADLAVGSMTINSAREKVIDFTKPFRNLGISILFKLPKKPPARLFSFLNPLSAEIWAYVGGAYLVVCCTLFVVARFTPGEWLSPPPCSGDEGVLENQFSFPNSVWFITGTFLRQGSGLNPKTTSTRLVGGIWWFFTLIIVSSYTANLAAFLTVDRRSTPIESDKDLADQSDISYGTLDSGSTMDFFRNSSAETHQKMWRYMEKRADVFVQTYEQGIDKVLEGNYAFLIESPMLDYVMQRDCNLTQIGGLLDSKGYGIAMPKGSPWRDKLSLAILELQEKGIIQLLYNKWWKNSGDVCNEKKDSKAASPLAENIGGVFVVLFAGLIMAIFAAICEFSCHVRKHAALRNTSFCSELKEDFKVAFCCCCMDPAPSSWEDESESQHQRGTKLSPSSTYVPVIPNSSTLT